MTERMVSTTPLTIPRAASIGLVTAVLMPFQMVELIDWIAFHVPSTTERMPFTTPVTVDLMPFQMDDAIPEIAPNTDDVTDDSAFHAPVTKLTTAV
ncbi:MAG: hypothetical protein ABW122_08930, partial [Ilumatobacteraceae bacterium]